MALALVACLAAVAVWWSAGGIATRDDEAAPAAVDAAPAEPVDSGAAAPAAGSASASESRTSREAVLGGPAALIRGRVRDRSAPIEGARVAWVALQKEDAEPYPSWPRPGWGILPRESIEVRTNADGEFVFTERPSPELPFASVLVAVGPGFLPSRADIPADEAQWPGLVDMVLEPCASIDVQVIDPVGKAVEGAAVHNVPRDVTSAEPGQVSAPHDFRFLEDIVLTNADGHARVALHPGEQMLWAQHGERTSRPWFGKAATQVVLTLGESFTIGGTLSCPDRAEWDPTYEGERRILVHGMVDNFWRLLVSVRDVEEGEWGPVRVPLADVRQFRLRVEGIPIMPLEEVFDPPAASSHRHFDFVAQKEENLWLFVVDEEQKPIANATALAWWSPGPNPEGGKYTEGASRTDGYLFLGTFPPGFIGFQVTATGYAAEFGEAQAPGAGAQVVTLRKGGRITGRCTSSGQPVPDFDVIYWMDGNPRIPRRESFLGRLDGSFDLAHLAPGEWSLHAATALHPGGPPIRVRVERDAVTEVEIVVPPGIRGGGRVVDAETGAALPGAEVQVYSSGGLEKSFPWGAPVETLPDGSFDLEVFVLGTNHLQARADGYSPGEAVARAASTDFLDWGDIALFRPQSLELRLIGLEGLSGLAPTDLTAVEFGGVLPERPFDREGVVRYEDVAPGDRRLSVFYPDGSWDRLNLRLDPGKDWSFELDVSGHRRLTARVLDAEGKPLEFVPMVVVLGTEDTGTFVARLRTTPKGDRYLFEGLRAHVVQVLVYQPDGTLITSRNAEFGNDSLLDVEIRLGGEPTRVHVVDREGAPIAGAWVTVRSASGSETHGKDDTDGDGWATVVGVPEGPALLDLHHGIAGRRQGIAIDGSVREHEIVLAAEGGLVIRVVDGDEPLATVSARIETSGGVTLSEALQTDAQGIVRFEPLGEGTYRIGLRRTDCWPAVLERALAADETVQVDVQMRRLADLELTLLDRNGVLVSGAEVALASLEFGADVASWVREERVRAPQGLSTDVRGVLRLEGLPRGAYSWSLSGGEHSGSFELAPAQANRVQLRLAN